MRFAIVGAGAVGAFVAARLAAAGEDVAVLARGAQLGAIRDRGVRVRSQAGELEAHPFAAAEPAEIGPVDVVFLALKAHSLPDAAARLTPLLGPDTPVVTGQNGIPWWYFQSHGGPLEGMHLESIDPGGILSRTIPLNRVIGCVIYFSTLISEPGVVVHVEGNRLAIGEPDGKRSGRCEAISHSLQKAGLRCPIRARIRHDIWVKLIGNLAFNPISALARATMEQMIQDPGARALTRAVMEEGEAVARALGVELEIGIDRRMEGAARVGPHKTSMLQDLEAGRRLELESIVGAVVELADRLAIPIPHTKTLYACAKLLARTQGAPP